MPFMRLYSLELPLATKRELARELTAATVRALNQPAVARNWTTVQFMPFRPEDFAIGGQLASDAHHADYHLDFLERGLTYEHRAALVHELTPLLARLLEVPADRMDMITILFSEYDAGDLAIGGRFISDMERQRPYEALEQGQVQAQQ